MTFEYCETCKGMMKGRYFTAATPYVRTFLCGVCNGITYINIDKESSPEVWDIDLKLRNEAVELQPKYIKMKTKGETYEFN